MTLAGSNKSCKQATQMDIHMGLVFRVYRGEDRDRERNGQIAF